MIKNKFFFKLSLFLISQQIMSVGGGIFLYRYNQQNELEFLFAFDPHQKHPHRIGFEYPAGKIDKQDHLPNEKLNFQDPYSLLYGAARETLEELVFIPSILINPNLEPFDDKSKKLNNSAATSCIMEIIKKIQSQGIFFIHESNQIAVFFLDITNICPPNLPATIVQKRCQLHKEGFSLKHLHAEPIAFAWVKAKDLLPFLQNPPDNVWIPTSQFAIHNTHKNTLETQTNGHYSNVVHGTTILISKACMGLIKDQFNQQPNQMVIKKENHFILAADNNPNNLQVKPNLSASEKPSSSMRKIIELLQDQKFATIMLKGANSQSKQPKQCSTKNLIQALELSALLKK